jgi:hypothetical protein
MHDCDAGMPACAQASLDDGRARDILVNNQNG